MDGFHLIAHNRAWALHPTFQESVTPSARGGKPPGFRKDKACASFRPWRVGWLQPRPLHPQPCLVGRTLCPPDSEAFTPRWSESPGTQHVYLRLDTGPAWPVTGGGGVSLDSWGLLRSVWKCRLSRAVPPPALAFPLSRFTAGTGKARAPETRSRDWWFGLGSGAGL